MKLAKGHVAAIPERSFELECDSFSDFRESMIRLVIRSPADAIKASYNNGIKQLGPMHVMAYGTYNGKEYICAVESINKYHINEYVLLEKCSMQVVAA